MQTQAAGIPAIGRAALNPVAEKLYRSIKSGSPRDFSWFEEALDVALLRNVGLDQVILGAVREVVDQVRREQKPDSPTQGTVPPSSSPPS